MRYEDVYPNSMSVEELDARYGKPEKTPLVIAILAVMSNVSHDTVTVEVLNEAGQRHLMPFTQDALKRFIDLCAPQAEGEQRPKTN